MYSFQPLVDTTWNSHVGFYVTVILALMVVGLLVWNAGKTTAYLWFAGCVSALTFAVTFVVFIAQAIVPDVPNYVKALEISWHRLVAILLYMFNARS